MKRAWHFVLILLVARGVAVAGATTFPITGSARHLSEQDRKRAEHLANEGLDALDQHRFADAESKLRAALERVPDKATWIYNLACAQSMQGKIDGALDSLEKATDFGFTDFTHLEHDPGLSPLRETERYKKLIARKDAIRHHAAELALEQLKAQFGSKYLYEADEDHKLIFAAYTDQATLDALKQLLLDQAASQWEALFSHKPDEFIRIVIPTDGDFRKLVTQRGVAGIYLDESRTLIARRMGQIMVHEFTHALHAADQRAVGQMHPVWLREGIASMYEAGEFEQRRLTPKDNYRLSYVQQAARHGALLPLEKLVRLTPEQFTANANLAYGESSSLLLYLYEKDLLRAFYDRFKAEYSEDQTGKIALQKTTGMTLPELQKAWTEWMLPRTSPPLQPGFGSAILGVRFDSENDGLKISLLIPNGPAMMSGLKIGDVIVGIDGRDVRDYPSLLSILSNHSPNDLISVKYRRENAYVTVPVVLGKR